MATTITTNLNDADEAILNALASEYNTSVIPPAPTVTPSQFFREHVRDWLRSHGVRLRASRLAAYKKATPTEQAQIDAILDQYR